MAFRVNGLSDDGFLLHAGRQGLLIAAKRPIGVLYGVYAFLEEHVGMRWFFRGEDGESGFRGQVPVPPERPSATTSGTLPGEIRV